MSAARAGRSAAAAPRDVRGQDDREIDEHPASQTVGSRGKKRALPKDDRAEIRRGKQPATQPDPEEEEDDDDGKEAEVEEEEEGDTGDARLQAMEPKVLDQMVSSAVRLALFTERQRSFLKRVDFSTIVADHKYAFPLVLDRTKEYLKNVFGMELVPVKYSISRKGTKQANTTKSWVLVNALKDKPWAAEALDWRQDLPRLGLLRTILALTLMAGRKLPEAELWEFLKSLGLERGNKRLTGPLDDPEEAIRQFVKEQYIAKVKVAPTANAAATFVFVWGPRAYVEFTEVDTFQFLAEIFGKSGDKGFLVELRRQSGVDELEGEGEGDDDAAEGGDKEAEPEPEPEPAPASQSRGRSSRK